MRSKKIFLNVSTSLLLQITSVICGFIVPKLIISTYGSTVNGLVVSIGQFLSYIVLLEAGAGGVIRAALYKLLARNDILSISRIMKSSEVFFKKIAHGFLFYLLLVAIALPFLTRSDFGFLYTMSLVLIIGMSIFSQYFFGISFQILLQADQKQYVSNLLQLLTLIINLIFVVVLIKLGLSIHFVQFTSSLVFTIRPFLLNFYVKKTYRLSKNCTSDDSALSDRWHGLAHHIAYFITHSTDIVILTILVNIAEVSVYSVYFLVVSGVKNFVLIFSTGVEAAFGNMIANYEKESLLKNFKAFEFFIFSITTILFGSTTLLIMPFVSVYTAGIIDVNYVRPIFSTIIVFAYSIYCVRQPYNAIIFASGHYKQTKQGAIYESMINIGVSIILVNFFGIIGVAIGTLCAMLFRTIQNARYISKNILFRSFKDFIRISLIFLICYSIIFLIVSQFPKVEITNYVQWFIYAMKVFLTSTIVTFIFGFIGFKSEMIYLIHASFYTFKKLKNQ